MKKTLALFLALIMVLACIAGCGAKPEASAPAADAGAAAPAAADSGAAPSAADPAAAEPVIPEGVAEKQVVKTMYSSEMSDWNPLHPSAAGDYANWIDTLVEYDNYSMLQPCLAESWTQSEDGLVWTFKIREGVKWQYYDGTEYGTELVAEDWVTTAKWILTPSNTARTADLLFDMVGAEDYYNALEAGQAADWSTVGIKAISTYELQFTLMAPCPYFLSRLTYNWGYPTCAKYLEEMGEQFGTSNTTILYNGAFLCTQFEPNSYMISERNPLYWDLEDIHIERIEERFNAEANTLEAEALLRGEVTSASIPAEQLDGWLNDPARAAMIRPNRPGTDGNYSYFFGINFMPTYEEKVLEGYQLDTDQWKAAVNNINFRKSLYYAVDRIKAISCYNEYTPEEYLLRTVTPYNFCAADGKDYPLLDALTQYSTVDQFQADKAVEYKDKAIAELTAAGVTFPIIAYMPYRTESTQANLAVVVSQQMEELLGTDYIKFVLEGYPATDYLNTTRRAGNYSFTLSWWGPDYADPQTYTDPFNLGQAYNYIWHGDGMATQVAEGTEGARMGRTGFDETWWIDFVYADMVDKAVEETVDLSVRYNALAETEAWLLENACIIPLGDLDACGYMASNLNPFESQYAPFGLSSHRYKYQWVYEDYMNTEEYLAALEAWEAERTIRIEAAEAAGIDY